MATIERAFGVTNIKHHIPVILDLDVFNYDAWRELFLTHCLAFDVLGHVDGTAVPQGDDDTPWKKRDRLVKLWIYGTLAPPLFKTAFKTGGTARDAWLRIENQFRNNKKARAIQLDNDLRTKEINDLSVHDYSQSLKSLADLLENVEAPISDKTLVMYMLNGLNEKYGHIINMIKHQKPFPSFEEARNMLEMEETRLKKTHKVTIAHSDHSSSSTAIVASDQPPKQSYNQQRNQPRNNRGNRHGNRGRGRYNNYNYQQRHPYGNWGMPTPFWPYQYNNWQNPQTPSWMMQSTNGYNQRPYTLRPNTQEAHIAALGLQLTTDFAESFNTMSLAEPSPNCYMDSGATSHLASSLGILRFVLKMNTGNSIVVGNGSSISIHASGSSFIPCKNRFLALKNVLVAPQIVKNLISVRKFTTDNWCSIEFDPFGFSVKDLQSRKTLLRSESLGDLYPVPASLNKSHQHSTFVAETPSLWHKRLIHSNNDTLRFFISSRSLLCNKDNIHFCDACQLGKHIKLPFFKSTGCTAVVRVLRPELFVVLINVWHLFISYTVISGLLLF